MDPIVSEPVRGVIGDTTALKLPGLDAMRRAVRGEAPAPPISHLFGLEATEVGLGTSTFTMPVTPWLQDAFGIIWGGVYAIVADAPIATALQTGLPPGKAITTSELSINFLRPATSESGRLVGRARSVYLGRSVGVSEATIEDARGRTMAHATTRCVIQDIPFDPDAELLEPASPITDPPDPYLRDVPDGLGLDLSMWEGQRRLDVQRALGKGNPGPIGTLTGMAFDHVRPGAVALTLPASPWFSNGTPFAYGGLLAWACDTALVGAVWTTLDAGAVAPSLDLQVRFVRPLPVDGGTLDVTGTVIHSGRSLRVAQAEVTNAEGKVVAIASGSSLVIDGGMDRLVAGGKVDQIVNEGADLDA